MEDILSAICAHAKYRVEQDRKKMPEEELKRQAYALPAKSFALERALGVSGLSFLCEIKKASPSKGVIDPVFDYMSIARDYVRGGADGISCLTEPKWFLGSDEIFSNVRAAVSLPMLRKDFTVSPYQVYGSRLLGADAVLLILDALPVREAQKLFGIAEELGMSALFECRDRGQIETAQKLGGRVIGVNNRNLRDFSVDTNRAKALRAEVDSEKIFVAESGICSVEAVRSLREAGVDACLVGEYLMRAEDRVQRLKQMRGA